MRVQRALLPDMHSMACRQQTAQHIMHGAAQRRQSAAYHAWRSTAQTKRSTAQRTRDGQHGVWGGRAQQGMEVQPVALRIQALAHCRNG